MIHAAPGIVAAPKATASLQDVILGLNPVAYWKLDEPSGTSVVDASGNGHTGTISGTYTLEGVAGPDGGHTQFTNAVVTVADDSALSLVTAGGLSFFALIRPTNLSSRRFVIAKGAALSDFEWGIDVGQSGENLRWFAWNGSSGTRWHRTNIATTDEWQAVVATMAGNLPSSATAIYRNTEVAQGTPEELFEASTDQGGLVYIGRRASNNPFIGGIAHLSVFPGAFAQPHVKLLMDAARSEGWTP